MKAYQRLIRECAGIEPDALLDIGSAAIREISYAQAEALIVAHEYLGTMPAVVRHCYGLFFSERLAGVAVYADETAENLGVWDRYGYTGKIITLARGCCEPWAHPHSASKLIRGSMKLLPPKYAVVTATVDSSAGEIGTVYQACGFHYVGVMTKGGRIRSERAYRGRYGTGSKRKLKRKGIKVQVTPRKGRYFAFRGHRNEQAKLKAAIEHLIKPYPRRRVLGPRLIGLVGGRAGPGRGKRGQIVTRFPRGNSRAYTMARLARDRPDLALRVHAGELSAHAAAMEAGWRKGGVRKPIGNQAMDNAERCRRYRQRAAERQRRAAWEPVERLEKSIEAMKAVPAFAPVGPPEWWHRQGCEPLEISLGRVTRYA